MNTGVKKGEWMSEKGERMSNRVYGCRKSGNGCQRQSMRVKKNLRVSERVNGCRTVLKKGLPVSKRANEGQKRANRC